MKNKQKEENKEEFVELEGKQVPLSEIISDRQTMTKYISLKNRPDFYYLCSEELKKDYDFVIFLLNYIRCITLDKNGEIKKYPVIKVVDSTDKHHNNKKEEKTFINNSQEVNKLLMSIIYNFMSEENCNKKRKQVFSVAADAIKVLDSSYQLHKECNNICKYEIALALQRTRDFSYKAEANGTPIGLGFYYIRCSYNHYENLLEVFAKYYIEKIFTRNDLSLEKELHKEFYSKEHLEEYGVKAYLLNYVARCDQCLYEYLRLRTYLLDDKCNEVDTFINRWNKYIVKEKTERYKQVFENIREYIDAGYYPDATLSELDIMAYVVKELELPEGIFIYDQSGYIMTRSVLKQINYEKIRKQINNSRGFGDRRMYTDIKRIFIETLQMGFKTDSKFTNPTFSSARNDLFKKVQESDRCRIITHDFKNKRLDNK